jgi:hypothetical protein
MMEGCLFVLFCTYEIHGRRMLQIMFMVSLEGSGGGGVHGLDVQKLLNIK